MDFGQSIKFGWYWTGWIISFVCNLVQLILEFAVLEYLDELNLEPGVGSLQMGL